MRPSLFAALCAAVFACPLQVSAEPLTLDALLALEGFGRVAVDPSGAIGVFEERLARIDQPRFDLQPEGALRYACLYRVDLNSPTAPVPLLPMADDAGYTLGPFSPGGTRVVVFRLQDLSWRLGLVELATGAVIWTEISPELPAWGRSVEWLSEDALAVIGMRDGGLPPRLERMRRVQARLPDLWDRAGAGKPAYVSVGLGAPSEPPPTRRLWRLEATTGQATALTDGPFIDMEASPDGRTLALMLDGALLPPPNAQASTEVRRARSLRLVDAATGLAIDPAEAQDVSTSLLVWSPRSDALLVARLNGPEPRLLSVSPSGLARDVTPDGVAPDVAVDMFGSPTAQAGWLAERPVVLGRSGDRPGWYVNATAGARRVDGLDADARLVAQGRRSLLFESGGRLVRVAADLHGRPLGRAAAAVSPEGPVGQRAAVSPLKAAFAVMQDDGGRLCHVAADEAPVGPCVEGTSGSAISWSRRLSLGAGRSGRDRDRLTLRRTGQAPLEVRRLNPELDTTDVARPVLVEGPKGARGWLYQPARSDAPRPPVVVIPYPGRTHPVPPRKMSPEALDLTQNGQILVAAGYAVLFPDLPASAEPADGLADRILAVVDAAADQGLVDRARIGLWGHSFGAWSALTSVSQSSRFAAVVALNGAYNFQSVVADMAHAARVNGENDEAVIGSARWLETGQAAMHKPYWSDPQRYRRNSPFEAADRITTPILLIHGDMDFGPTQSEQMYAALHRLKRPAALTLLFGEDHGVHGPGNLHVYYDQTLAWFDRYLRPEAGRGAPASASAKLPSGPG